MTNERPSTVVIDYEDFRVKGGNFIVGVDTSKSLIVHHRRIELIRLRHVFVMMACYADV